MLNDSTVMSTSFSAVQNKKGHGAFKKFQGRLKHILHNIGMEEITKKSPTVWDRLRSKK